MKLKSHRLVTQILPLLVVEIFVAVSVAASSPNSLEPSVTILVYHRLGPFKADSMTVTTEHFKEQLDLLHQHNYSIISLAEVVAWRLGRGTTPPPRSVVVTFDDGHVSVFREARAIVMSRRIPVTLFVYPSCISNASYAMTWKQVEELVSTPFFIVQSHTYWHPNFKREARRLSEHDYQALVDTQLGRSKVALQDNLQRTVNLLAWPFGIYDSFLMNRAKAAGYEAGFSLDCRAVTASDPVMALPRCLVSDEYVGTRFVRFIESAVNSARSEK
jgi:peptidoglycan/xylan/chitin deacetylase (PgdA/CDA1 family)